METPEPATLRFGSFELDVRSRELRRGTRRVRLQEQPFEILRLMLARPGEVVTRDELRTRLWPEGTFVDFEHSLNAAVKRLRAALGDDADNPRFVETLPRRGYRFIAPMQAAVPTRPTASACEPRTRLVVLPFSNLSDDSSQEFFTDGLTEELIAQLGPLCRGQVGVIARWSAMAFKGSLQRASEIGAMLRADYILEGSVRRDAVRVRITARLIEAATEAHLWSETYERTISDWLAVQADVASCVARSLVKELVVPPRHDPAPGVPTSAYQAYLKGQYHWARCGDNGLDNALTYFEQAAASPGFAAAHGALARARVALAEYYRELPRAALQAARESASRALEIDPSLAEGYVALADVRRTLTWDWDGAADAYEQAIAANPSNVNAPRRYGLMHAVLGRHAEAVARVEQACSLDPLCLTANSAAAWVSFAAGDLDAAIARCRHALDMDPRFEQALCILGAALLQAGRTDEALRQLECAVSATCGAPVPLATLAHARAIAGAPAEARRRLEQARSLERERYVSPHHLALAYVGLGDLDAAFAALDQAWLDRDPALANVMIDPRFEPVRRDGRYAALLERMNLAPVPARARAPRG